MRQDLINHPFEYFLEASAEATRLGVDVPSVQKGFAKIISEVNELGIELGEENVSHSRVFHEIGDVILASCRLAEKLGFNPEDVFVSSVFRLEERARRFSVIAGKLGKDPLKMSSIEASSIWREAKSTTPC